MPDIRHISSPLRESHLFAVEYVVLVVKEAGREVVDEHAADQVA